MASDRITFLVPGVAGPVAPATRGAGGTIEEPSRYGTVTQSAVLSTVRAAQAPLEMTATPGEDLVVLHIDNGPELVLHPEHARDLMLAQSEVTRSGGAAAPGTVQVPVRLQWRGLESNVPTRGATRGFLGDVILRAIEIVKGKVADSAADFAASAIVKKFDDQVNAGVYLLSPDSLPPLKASGTKPLPVLPSATGPMLVLIHGTFSTTNGTFSKLWTEHAERVRDLFEFYDGGVYALDHPTLGVSPIANALTLAKAAPAGARLHLVTHSRGGLVAEVLARVCARPDDPFTPFTRAGYATELAELRALAAEVNAKKFTVERLVRVACPSRGTLLASRRLDAYVSVLKWALELAGVPVVPMLVDFLGEVARRRADPESLPGLAAQIPDSPLVQWLHSGELRIGGDLRVVAGDMQGDSIRTWLKTLMSDAFYWTDNDLVVQTRSMYGGTPRDKGSIFVLDRGGNVSHFSYFSNTASANAIVNGLTSDRPSGFQAIGPLSWAGESATGTRAALVRSAMATPERPALFILPGILGSNLGIKGDRIWLGWRVVNGFGRLKYAEGVDDGVEPDGPIGAFYDDLAVYLSKTHDVIPFAFDWRRPMEHEAHDLADAVTAALDARLTSGQPVRLLAHSMGGIVARAMQIERPEVWKRMMQHDAARLLMLGTPNGGSWAPMQVLTGDDTFGNLIVTVGAPFRSDATRQMVAGFPGLLQLQAGLLDSDLKLASAAEWQRLADADLESLKSRSWWHHLTLQLDVHKWGVPTQAVLDAAATLRQKLDAQAARAAEVFGSRAVLVAGHAPFTPAGFRMDADGLVYLGATDGGDGRVPLASALLPGVRTWSVDHAHGDLPKAREAFPAYAELLEKGTTALLPMIQAQGTTRGASEPASTSRVRSRPARNQYAPEPPRLKDDVLSPSGEPAERPSAPSVPSLQVEIVHGDLMFVAEPLLIGHYRSTRLTGAEAVMDALVGGQMSESLRRGLYPVMPGSHQVFLNTRDRPDNPWQLPRPKSVIVVGLGEEGSLSSNDLLVSVRQAVIAWAHRLAEQPAPPATFTLAATLVGSGGVRITVGESAQLVAQAVREANDRLDGRDGVRAWPTVARLRLIELYLDRATEAWRAVRILAAASPSQSYSVGDVVSKQPGGLPRALDASYRGADYDFISAIGENDRIVYSMDTRRARTEVQAQSTQGSLIRQLVKTASNQTGDEQIGSTLFQLLVPVEIEPFLAGSTETVLEVNDQTAGIPWELLSAQPPGGSGAAAAWAIRTKLVRKLRTDEYRSRVIDADADAAVLIIGEPECDPKIYPRLDGARREAKEVLKTFTNWADPSMVIKALISPDDPSRMGADAQAVLNAVLARDWRIIHIAGHGEPPLGTDPRGVVLSSRLFFGPREVRAMRIVPELVFVNCCYLAARDAEQVLASPDCLRYDRPRFAAGVGDELIRLGVRCVIAAGWAIDDAAAQKFATTFYEAILARTRFMDAVGQAREAAQQLRGNTWASYQCYGDPDWVFRRRVTDAQRPTPARDALASVASEDALVLALQTVAVRAKFSASSDDEARGRGLQTQVDRVKYLEMKFGARWGSQGAVATAFGDAWAELGDTSNAIAWYERAQQAPDGMAAIRAIEQLANMRVRAAWTEVSNASEADAPEARTEARKTIAEAVSSLEALSGFGDTAERQSLCGAAYKRLALIAATEKSVDQERASLTKMAAHCANAARLAGAAGSRDVFYPAMNGIAADIARVLLDGTPLARPEAAFAAASESLRSRVEQDPDFWSVVGQTELKVYDALFKSNLAASVAALVAEFTKHHDRVQAPRWWGSVYDNAVFVLSKYRSKAAAPERVAADTLLAALFEFTARTPPPVAKAKGPRRTAATGHKKEARKKR